MIDAERKMIAEIKRLRSRGFSIAGIAKQTGCAPAYVAGVLHETWTFTPEHVGVRR